MSRLRLLSLAVVALLGAGLVAGCGGGGDEDPQQVLDETFSNDQSITSGVVDLSLSASAEGEEGGNIDASLSGPFQSEGEEELPRFDLTVDASGEGEGQSFDFSGGLVATEDQAFVRYGDDAYEVPQRFFNQVKRLSEQAADRAQRQGDDEDADDIFQQLGIDPSGWLTNLENEGDTDVEGEETIHISGDADVPAILQDLQSAAEQTGSDEELTEEQIQEAENAVEEASIDVYSGKDDRILRRLDVNLALAPEDGEGVDSVDLEISLTFSGVNEEQTIEAPADARSFSDLESAIGLPPGLLEGALRGQGLGGDLGLDSGGAGGAGAGGGGGGGGGGGSGGGGAAAPDSEAGQAYLDCLSEAQTQQEISACLEELE